MKTRSTTIETQDVTTTVTVRCTGRVRDEVGSPELEYEFPGGTLREFLAAFFEEYPVEELLIAHDESQATAPGWAPAPKSLSGANWRKNPEGEQTRQFARILVNGTFNEHLGGLDTVLEDGDRVALVNPFVFCV